MRGVNGPAALCGYRAAVGATGGSSKCGSLNVKEWLQPREVLVVEVALQRYVCARRTCHLEGEAVALWEEASKSTAGVSRGMGPSTYTRIAEIMLGKASFQQGRAATCKDSWYKGETEAVRGLRSGA